MASDTEVPTQELPSPTEVVEAPATSEEAATPLPAAEEVAPPEPESPFASVRDEYEVVEHPRVKPVVEKMLRRREEALAAEYEQRQQQETRNWEATETYKTIAGLQGRILEQIDNGNVEASERLIGRLESLAKPFEPEYQQHFQQAGAAQTFQSAMAAFKEGLDMRRQDELDDVRQRRGATWGDLIAARVKVGVEREREKWEKDGIEKGRKAALEDIAARERGDPNNNPDLAPKSAGATGWRTKAEARALHVQNKITNEEMKRIRSDPNIPE